MNDETGRPEPAASPDASADASSCCGVSACRTDAEQAVDPGVTVQQAKTDAGCGCAGNGALDGLPVVVIGAGPVGLAAAVAPFAGAPPWPQDSADTPTCFWC